MSQRVLVTAGASGIGREIARAFAANGGRVFVCDIDAGALGDLRQEMPGMATAVCDVSKRQEVAQMVDAAASTLGGLDVLVNNAGIDGPTAPVDEVDPDEWEKVLQVNLTGTLHVTRCAIPHLKRSPAGVIVNMSSVAGRIGYANRSAYASSKWGVIGLTKTLAVELGQFGIRANAILPGAVEGPRIERVFEARAAASGRSVEEVKRESMEWQSIKRLVDPQDVAALAVFLASDSAKSITGAALSIDNGLA